MARPGTRTPGSSGGGSGDGVAKTGDTMTGNLDVTRAAATDSAVRTMVDADANPRLIVRADGRLVWGGGTATGDVELYRHAADSLKTLDRFIIERSLAAGQILHLQNLDATGLGLLAVMGAAGALPFATYVNGDTERRFTVTAGGMLTWGSGSATGDTNLYRSAVDTLRTDDNLDINKGLALTSATPTITATAINAANRTDILLMCRVSGEANHQFYLRANGSLNWGPGGATAVDTVLYRDAADVLATDDTVKIKRGSTTNQALTTYVGAESNPRLLIQANGVMVWGAGSGAGDVNLYRGASDVLKTDDALEVVSALYGDADIFARANGTYEVKIGDIGSKAGLTFGSAADTNLYRTAADTLMTDDSLHVGSTFRHLGSSLGFYNAAAVSKPTVTGSRGDGSALADLLTELATLGLITDSSSA